MLPTMRQYSPLRLPGAAAFTTDAVQMSGAARRQADHRGGDALAFELRAMFREIGRGARRVACCKRASKK